jgi:hypothetical protein
MGSNLHFRQVEEDHRGQYSRKDAIVKFNVSAIAAALLLALSAVPTQAQDVYGYVYLPVPAQSDVLVSVPLNNAPQGDFTITAGGISGSVITVDEPIADTLDAGKCYVRFVDGGAAGLLTTITANSSSSFTLENATAAALASTGDTVRLFKHHTVGSVFSANLLGISFVNQTQLLFFADSVAKNKAPGSEGTATYFDVNDFGWGLNATRVIKPEEAFVVRNNSANPLVFVAKGMAPNHKVAFIAPAGAQSDAVRGHGYPVNLSVTNTNYGGLNQRQILTVNNEADGKNKAPGSGATYTYFTAGNFGWGLNANVPLAPNGGYIFRQNGDAGGKITEFKPY